MFKYKLPEQSMKKDYLFNMIGSVISSGISLLLLIMVSHILGENDAGVFSLTYTSAQMLLVIGVFELRNVQVTIQDEWITFSDVLGFRLLSIGLMLVISFGFVFLKGFDLTKSAALIILVVYMGGTALSEVFQGNMQRQNYLALGGISLGGISLLSILFFIAGLLISHDLIISLAIMMMAPLLWVFFYDLPFSRNLGLDKPRFLWRNIKKLFLSTIPLVIAAFLTQYTFNAPKYAINDYLSDIEQSHYGYLMMPTFFINLLVTFIFRPQYVSLSRELWTEGKKSFIKKIVKLYLIVIGITAMALIGGYLLGIPILNILYGTDLNSQKNELLILLLAGGFNAASNLTIQLITIIKQQKMMIIAYVLAFIVAELISGVFVQNWGLLGASFSYLLVMVILFVLSILIFIICLKGIENQR